MSHLVRDITFVPPSDDEDEDSGVGKVVPSTGSASTKKKKKMCVVAGDEDAVKLHKKKAFSPIDHDIVATTPSDAGVVSGDEFMIREPFAHVRSSKKKSKKNKSVPATAIAEEERTESNPGVRKVYSNPKPKNRSPSGKTYMKTFAEAQAVMMPMIPAFGGGDDNGNAPRHQSHGGLSDAKRRSTASFLSKSEVQQPGAVSSSIRSVLFGRVRTADTRVKESDDEEVLEEVAVRATLIDEAAYRNEVLQDILREQENTNRARTMDTGVSDFSSTTNPPLVHAVRSRSQPCDPSKDDIGSPRRRPVYAAIGCAILAILGIAIGLAVGLTRDPNTPSSPFQEFCNDVLHLYETYIPELSCTCVESLNKIDCIGATEDSDFVNVQLEYNSNTGGYSGRDCSCQGTGCQNSPMTCITVLGASASDTLQSQALCELSGNVEGTPCSACTVCESSTPYFRVDVAGCPNADPSQVGCIKTNVVNTAHMQPPTSMPIRSPSPTPTSPPSSPSVPGATQYPTEASLTQCELQCQELTGSPVTYSDIDDLKRAILEYLRDPSSSPHGPSINCWNVSQVIDMSFAFSYFSEDMGSVHNPELDDPILQTFNEDLDCWDTSSVTNMRGMFANASSFNGNIGSWDVSQVTDMGWMFYSASSFNANISEWQVGKAFDMGKMFANAAMFNGNIGSWDVSSCNYMDTMFEGAENFNSYIGDWDTSNVIQMDWMFNLATRFNQPLANWDVSNVRDMSNMFKAASTFSQDIGNWEVGNVRDMYQMFAYAPNFDNDIGDWDVSNVKNMSYMFAGSDFNQPIGNWQTLSLTNATGMFADATKFNQPIGNLFTGSLVDISEMFFGASSFAQPLNDWDVSNVKAMRATFYEASSFDQPLSQWDVSQCEDFSYMFNRADVFNQPLGNWVVSNAKDMRFMFFGAFNYNQGLCAWGNLLNVSEDSEVDLLRMFEGSGCNNETTPSSTSTSWCQVCA